MTAVSIETLLDYAVSAVRAILKKYPLLPAHKYPTVLVVANRIEVPIAAGLTRQGVEAMVGPHDRASGAAFLGPLSESPHVVSILVWHGAEMWTREFDPKNGVVRGDGAPPPLAGTC